MFYNVLKINELVQYETNKIDKSILLEDDSSLLMAVALKKNEIIDTHETQTNACVYVFKGSIEMHFDAEKFVLNEGEILLFKKHEKHSVNALTDSKFLVIRI